MEETTPIEDANHREESATDVLLHNQRKRNVPSQWAWTRKLSAKFPPLKEFSVSVKDGAKSAMLGYRVWKYVRNERNAGRKPIMDPFNSPTIVPLMGVPIGGIGCGSIGRGWRGDFLRWQVYPCGIASLNEVAADQFSVYINHVSKGEKCATVLNPEKPKASPVLESAWNWGINGSKSTYHALFPRAWSVYEEPDPNVRLTCRQVSPVIPHNYKESSYPCGVFVWTIENLGSDDVEASVMFSFQNGMGTTNDTSGGHTNSQFSYKASQGSDIKGITLKHNLQHSGLKEGAAYTYTDPLAFSLAVSKDKGVHVTRCTKFQTNSKASAESLWKQFSSNGEISDVEEWAEASTKGASIGGAIAAKVFLPPNSSKSITFSLAWDCPIARFSSGNPHFRKYTEFYGKSGSASDAIAADALLYYSSWEDEIDQWQNPILNDPQLPDYYKYALFNELYYIVDGGSIWTTDSTLEDLCVGMHLTKEDAVLAKQIAKEVEEIGHFAYLESLEYLMYNTYDVHFYASFALCMLWPKLELSLQRDVAIATLMEIDAPWEIMHSGKKSIRKVRGAVPHDMGNPGEDPWNKVNAYCIQDIARWKDLPCKFVLQVYRDYIVTKDIKFLMDTWPVIKKTIEYTQQFDFDNDGVIDNEGFPDQTYDIWSVTGCSAYSGGLWLACLTAAVEIAALLKDDSVGHYASILEKGKKSYQEKLWSGTYYLYDSSNSAHHDSIMADQLAGQWYAKACGLPSVIPESNAFISLQTIFNYNVKSYRGGNYGAINGMRPNGSIDTTCMQSVEVWTGTTYALAACMLQQGLFKEAFETAKGIIIPTYNEFGYMFQTPEAWDTKGHYRSSTYMRPLAIWAMQYAWERFYSHPAPSELELPLDSEVPSFIEYDDDALEDSELPTVH